METVTPICLRVSLQLLCVWWLTCGGLSIWTHCQPCFHCATSETKVSPKAPPVALRQKLPNREAEGGKRERGGKRGKERKERGGGGGSDSDSGRTRERVPRHRRAGSHLWRRYSTGRPQRGAGLGWGGVRLWVPRVRPRPPPVPPTSAATVAAAAAAAAAAATPSTALSSSPAGRAQVRRRYSTGRPQRGAGLGWGGVRL